MQLSPEIRLCTAHVHLLQMSVYSDHMLRFVSFGLQQAASDPTFFERQIRQIIPKLSPERVAEAARIKKDLDLDEALTGAKAASLIFTHAGVEACLEDLAALVAEIDPNAFLPLVRQKQVLLGDACEIPPGELLRVQIDRYLHAMTRQSIVERTRTMFRVLGASTSSFKFDEDRVERIERIRNDCAHGRVGAADFSTFYDDIAYLRDVGDFFIDCVAKRYQIPMTKFMIGGSECE